MDLQTFSVLIKIMAAGLVVSVLGAMFRSKTVARAGMAVSLIASFIMIAISLLMGVAVKRESKPLPQLHEAYGHLPKCTLQVIKSDKYVNFQGDDGYYLYVANHTTLNPQMCLRGPK